jgi:hypothetical protein
VTPSLDATSGMAPSVALVVMRVAHEVWWKLNRAGGGKKEKELSKVRRSVPSSCMFSSTLSSSPLGETGGGVLGSIFFFVCIRLPPPQAVVVVVGRGGGLLLLLFTLGWILDISSSSSSPVLPLLLKCTLF